MSHRIIHRPPQAVHSAGGRPDEDEEILGLDPEDLYPPPGRSLPRHLRRPSPHPHCAGITPGWRHLLTDDQPVSRRQLRRALRRQERETAAVIDALLARVESLERRLTDRGGPDGT